MVEEQAELSLNTFTEHFDAELSCGICLGQYTDPKTLPCHHSFCSECIEKYILSNSQLSTEDTTWDGIKCPTCRLDNPLPLGGAADLPSDFKLNSLLTLRKKLTKHGKQLAKCLIHNNPLEAFCRTCNQIICCKCTVKEHNNHLCYLITDCYSRYHRQILTGLDQLKQKMDNINAVVTINDIHTKKVLQQQEDLMEQIDTHTRQLIQKIFSSQLNSARQVNSIVLQKIQSLSMQKEEAQEVLAQLQVCKEKIEQGLEEWTQHQIIMQRSDWITEIEEASSQADYIVMQPLEEADIKFTKTDYTEQQLDFGVISKTIHANITLEVLPCPAKKQSTAVLTLQNIISGSPLSPRASFISSKLISGNKFPVKCEVTQTHEGIYDITFTPSTRHDQLIVKVGGVDILDSPFTLPVIPTPEMRGKPVHMITEADGPWGIAVFDNGDIVFAECSAHRVTILRKIGGRIVGSTFGSRGTNGGQFMYPSGVAVMKDGHILVTDNHRLQKLTIDGVCVKSVGSSKRGNGRCEFSVPGGIGVDPIRGKIYVADSGNNRIHVFSSDLTSLGIFLLGTNPRNNKPFDLAPDNDGHLFVAEYYSHCITKISVETGIRGVNVSFVKRIGSMGIAPGQLYHPTSLAILNNMLYVSERGNNRISVFSTDGHFLYSFGKKGSKEGEFDEPCGVAIDTFGSLYVCDTDNNRIVVF